MDRFYHLYSLFKSGKKCYLTAYPMTHDKCLIMRSKHMNPAIVGLEEVYLSQLRERILLAIEDGELFTTRQMCLFRGWQGGTIHQIAEITGLSIETLLECQS